MKKITFILIFACVTQYCGETAADCYGWVPTNNKENSIKCEYSDSDDSACSQNYDYHDTECTQNLLGLYSCPYDYPMSGDSDGPWEAEHTCCGNCSANTDTTKRCGSMSPSATGCDYGDLCSGYPPANTYCKTANSHNVVECKVYPGDSCDGQTVYRCPDNYWGSPISDSGTCNACGCMSDKDGIRRCGTSAAGSNSSQNSCKMDTGYSFSDDVGIWNFTIPCAESS